MSEDSEPHRPLRQIPMSEDSDPHPHQPVAKIPVQLAVDRLRILSRIDRTRALSALLGDWLVIAAAIGFALYLDWLPATALAVIVIGGRQHALTVVTHDAVHFRFLADRGLNDWVAELLAAWPVFLSVRVFRIVHAPHHRFLAEPGDGNRRAWRTHAADGELRPEWTYPKSRLGLAATILRRAALLTGALWIVRGLIAPFVVRRPASELIARAAFYGLSAWAIHALGAWVEFLTLWVLPYCTWHMVAQYTRLICEHSGRISLQPGFELTRSTSPGPLGRFFILPHNIGYHLEHHWYPSVPWYNLPKLRVALRDDPSFVSGANIQHSLIASLRQCLR